MEVVADLHVHSKHSRATGKDLDLANLEKWARIKGVSLLGTGDFTHPKWIDEIKANLAEDGSGILRSRSGFPFMLQTEISLIYTDKGKGRKVHHLVYAPDIDAAGKITAWLLTRGRVDYDGRPVFGIPSAEFVEKLKAIDERIEIIPAHIWTPWFSVFGANSGYDDIKDCFEDMTKHIFALETGLSSDPPMNHRISALDRFTLVSNSDLHSFWPWRIGREANVFDVKNLSYESIMKTIKSREGFVETIEVDPAFGKYHYTGHRNCGICFSPSQALEHRNICPICRKQLTVGVDQRVGELADRPLGYAKKDAIPFRKLLPLSDVLASVMKKAVASKAVWEEYRKLVGDGADEFDVLRRMPREALCHKRSSMIADAILRNREGSIKVLPGYDGEYGIPQFVETEAVFRPIRKPVQRGLCDYGQIL